MTTPDPVLAPEELARYADAVVRGCVRIGKGETLLVRAEPGHRELGIALAEAAYRAGARVVEVAYVDPLVVAARLRHGRDEALGAVAPWIVRRSRELMKPDSAFVAILGDTEGGYLDGIPPQRIALDQSRTGQTLGFFSRATSAMRARWTGCAWPTDLWASQVYPELPPEEARRRLGGDLLDFARLRDEDGSGYSGWTKHVRTLTARARRLTRLGLERLELRGPGTELRMRLVPDTRWVGGGEETSSGVTIAPNMPTEECFTSPDPATVEGTFRCSLPLSFQGRLISGIGGEFRGGRLVRLDADADDDRELLAATLDIDRAARRLGEVALVDSTSRIGRSGRTYFNTLLDENAAAHIAFGSGFETTRQGAPRRLNRSRIHLDVMIGTPEFEATGFTARGRRVPLVADGLWQI